MYFEKKKTAVLVSTLTTRAGLPEMLILLSFFLMSSFEIIKNLSKISIFALGPHLGPLRVLAKVAVCFKKHLKT